MDCKGQEVLEYLFSYGWALLAIVIVVGVLVFLVVPSEPDESSPEFRFCQAWAEEKGFVHINGYYDYISISGTRLECKYSLVEEVFGGAIVESKPKYKYFTIFRKDLDKWACDPCNCYEVCN